MASDYCAVSATLYSLHACDKWGCHCSNDKAGYQVYLNSQNGKGPTMHTPPPTSDTLFQFVKSNVTVLEPQVCDSTGTDVVFECTPVCFTESAKELRKPYEGISSSVLGESGLQREAPLMVGEKQQTARRI